MGQRELLGSSQAPGTEGAEGARPWTALGATVGSVPPTRQLSGGLLHQAGGQVTPLGPGSHSPALGAGVSGVENGLGLGLGLNPSEGSEGCWNGRAGGADRRPGDPKGPGGSSSVRPHTCPPWHHQHAHTLRRPAHGLPEGRRGQIPVSHQLLLQSGVHTVASHCPARAPASPWSVARGTWGGPSRGHVSRGSSGKAVGCIVIFRGGNITALKPHNLLPHPAGAQGREGPWPAAAPRPAQPCPVVRSHQS